MLVALDRNDRRVVAKCVSKSDGPFHCPACQHPVIIKKGHVYVHHFAHKARQDDCDFGGESMEHLRLKDEIALALRQAKQKRCREYVIGNQRADVLWFHNIDGERYRVAIEVQCTPIDDGELLRRTVGWTAKNCAVLWVLPWKQELMSDTYYLRQTERWLHTLYFGKVYYWRDGAITPVHFRDAYTYVEPTDFGGGYHRRLKRTKEPDIGPSVCIDQFYSYARPPFVSATVQIPRCRIMKDPLNSWWKEPAPREMRFYDEEGDQVASIRAISPNETLRQESRPNGSTRLVYSWRSDEDEAWDEDDWHQ